MRAPKGLGVSRRDFLKKSGAALSTSALSIAAITAPQVARSADIRFRLDVQETDDGPAYNGLSPGPTIRAYPGDVIDVDFSNSLPPLHDDCTDEPNNFHGANTTNLHTHGLHVSPTTDSTGEFDADNVFVSVVPDGQVVLCEDVCGAEVGTQFRWKETKYRFELGDDHPSGTYWYHAHKHGSTSTQVGAGLSGPLIIDDQPGAMPAYIEQATEKVLMIMNKGLILVDPNGGGEVDPTITMRPGEVQRWRVINALGNATDYSMITANLPELEMFLIAYDGFTLDSRVPVDEDNTDAPWLNASVLASGNRADFIVRAPLEGDGLSSKKGLFARAADLIGGGLVRKIDVDVEIAGDVLDQPWSDDDGLPGSGLASFDDTPLEKRDVAFTRRVSIDGGLFDGDVERTMRLGTAEEWTVSNETGALHVFHIHVNPFFITHINGQELPMGSPLRRWQDTIGVPVGDNAAPGTITYKTRFEKFTGKFVIHCHVLRHEDQGMMQTVEVI